MHFPKYWARAEEGPSTVWGWSDLSVTEAGSRAASRARQIASRLAAGEKLARYGYADRPLREEVLREVRDQRGDVTAAITRNSYGCQVLNAARVMFVDVDLPEPKPAAGGWLKSLFRKPAPQPPAEDPATAAIAKVEGWTRPHAGWGWRIYRTKAGLRLLAVHDLFDPTSAAVETLFGELGADPLYARLCRAQTCFRARLTPKPWRCGVPNPPPGWPWPDSRCEAAFRKWEGRYQTVSGGHATCAFVSAVGTASVHPAVQPIVTLHDEATRVAAALPLA
jgi:hypothetical protein